jgi:hypothetical protein
VIGYFYEFILSLELPDIEQDALTVAVFFLINDFLRFAVDQNDWTLHLLKHPDTFLQRRQVCRWCIFPRTPLRTLRPSGSTLPDDLSRWLWLRWVASATIGIPTRTCDAAETEPDTNADARSVLRGFPFLQEPAELARVYIPTIITQFVLRRADADQLKPAVEKSAA